MRWGLLATVLYTILSGALLWPILRHFGTALPHDAGDPILNTWLLWHSTQHLPNTSAWWNGPMFYPMRDSMALSETLLSILPLSAPVQWATSNPVAAYNAAFLASFLLSRLAMYALTLELTGRRDAALVAGLG